MCCERDGRDKAEHFSQVHVDSLTPAQQLCTLGNGVHDMGIEIKV